MRPNIQSLLISAFAVLFFISRPILFSTHAFSFGWLFALASIIFATIGGIYLLVKKIKTLDIRFCTVIILSHFFFQWIFTRQPNVWPANLRPVLYIPIIFTLVFLCSLVLGLLWTLLSKGSTVNFLWSKDEFSPSVKYIIQETLMLATALFILLAAGPVHIASAGNIELNGLLILTIALGCFFVAGFLVFILTRIFKGRYKFIESIFSALLLLIVLNAFIIPFQANLLDGGELGLPADDILPLLRNIFLFAILFLIAAKFRKNLRFVAVPIAVLTIALTAYNLNMSRPEEIPQEEIKANAVTFSTDQNIVVIVADMLQGTVVDYMFERYPYLTDSFDGFTMFNRAFTSFPFTRFSRETIHSGLLYSLDGVVSQEEHVRASVGNSFLSDMYAAGACVSGLHISLFGEFPSIPSLNYPTPPLQLYGYALAASVARLTGYWIFNPFGGHALDLVMADSIGSINAHNMLTNQLTAKGEELKLLYFWDYTMHTPVVFNRDGNIRSEPAARDDKEAIVDETYFGLNQLIQLFEAMKAQGVYDNSLIIIVSDHGHGFGQNIFHEGSENFGNFLPVFRYNTALFIKPPNARGSAQISHNPAWTGDVRAIVNFYHQNFENISPKDVMAQIRNKNPEVGVLFAPEGTTMPEMWHTNEHHQLVIVQSLYDIPAAFYERSR